MENQPLKNEVINVTNIELREKTAKNGNTWKEYNVSVKNQPKSIKYTLPIKKADGNFTKVYEFYKENKSEWEEMFIEGKEKQIAIAYSEKQSTWKTKEGKELTTTYRTIRAMREPDERDLLNPEVIDVEDDGLDVAEIPF